MHAPEPPRAAPAHVRGRAGEQAWGLVELLVAMAIMVVLAGIAIVAFGSARSSVYSKEAITAANAYNDAISKFQADHSNTLPTAADMLSPTTGSATRGPKSLLDPTKSYLTSMPDGVVAGRVAVKMSVDSVDCGTTPATPSTSVGTATSLVSYCPGAAAPDYAIRVLYKAKKDDTWATAKICWLGRTAATPRC